MMTNVLTKETIRLHDRIVRRASNLDGGYWNTEITYDDLKLGSNDYRVEGRLLLYLVGSQRTRDFLVYLKPESSSAPISSTIDWRSNDE